MHRISQLKVDQINHVVGVLKLSEPADSKTDPGFEISPRFEGVKEQNKIQWTYDHNCTMSLCHGFHEHYHPACSHLSSIEEEHNLGHRHQDKD